MKMSTKNPQKRRLLRFRQNEVIYLCNINKIKDLIKSKGLKVGSVCEKVGVCRTFLTDVEKGKCGMSDERLHKFAEILGTTVEYLNDETDDAKAEEKASEKEAENIDMELYRRIEALPEDMRGWLMDTLDRLEEKK